MQNTMLLVLFLTIFTKTNALPFGAPAYICQSMHPFHGGGIPGQLIPSPFEIVGNHTDLGYIVSIKVATGVTFEGVMLQARLMNGNMGGTFEPLNNFVYTINCQQPGDTITHSTPRPTSLLEVRWVSPNGYNGTVIFNSTVVQNYSTFWVGVQSRSLQISSNPQSHHDLSENTTKLADDKLDPFYEGCSITKLCFGAPDNCVQKENCKAVTAVTVKGNQFEFEMKAFDNPAWVGVGLSDDQHMGDDSVIECVNNGNSIKAYLSWTEPYPKFDVNRIADSQRGIELTYTSVEDGVLHCRVLRNATTSINGRDFDLVNTKYHILIAAGSQVQENKVSFHDIAFQASSVSSLLSMTTLPGDK